MTTRAQAPGKTTAAQGSQGSQGSQALLAKGAGKGEAGPGSGSGQDVVGGGPLENEMLRRQCAHTPLSPPT